jgi:hypothetical protein
MRAGTQTLIQALQAIPWMEDPDHDDEVNNHGSNTSPSIEGDEDIIGLFSILFFESLTQYQFTRGQ